MEQQRILEFFQLCAPPQGLANPCESTSTDQPTVTPSPNQDHIPPTLKCWLRRKRAVRNAVAITVSAESTAVTAEVGKSTPLFPELVENATVTPESVESVPVIPKPANPEAVKSAPILLEMVNSVPASESTAVLALGPVFIPEQPLKQRRKKGCVLESTVFPAAPESSSAAPASAPVWEPTESAPVREAAPVREPTESAPEAALVREPAESAPEAALVREPTESAPEAAPVR